MYDALTVAEYVIYKCNEKDYIISNLKLQKILYFIQAEFLVYTNNPCFKEKIEAWDFGPVVPEVYQAFKIYGSAHIPGLTNINNINIAASDATLIDEIVSECSNYSASELVEITHNQMPWLDAYKKYCNNEITTESIKKYFE